MKPGIQYKYPWIYRLFIPLIHRRPVIAAFRDAVGRDVSVFDVAAGFGGMARYLDRSTAYSGIDRNDTYVRYAQSQGLDVRHGDIFDPAAYHRSDVITLVDVIHHMPKEKLPALFDLVFRHAGRRVVIMEPAFVNLAEKYGPAARPVDWLLKKIDSDGINSIDHWFSQAEYHELFESRFGSRHGKHFDMRLQKVFPYYIVTYSRADAPE